MMNAGVVDVPGDGNCFFYALFRAACDHALLGRVCQCFGVDEDASEATRIAGARAEIAAYLVDNEDSRGRAYLRTMLALRDDAGRTEDDRAHYAHALSEAPDWFRSILDETPSHADVLRRVARDVRRDGRWIGQLENELVTEMLETSVGVRLVTSAIPARSVVNMGGPDALVVTTTGYHYRYVRFAGALRNKHPARTLSFVEAVWRALVAHGLRGRMARTLGVSRDRVATKDAFAETVAILGAASSNRRSAAWRRSAPSLLRAADSGVRHADDATDTLLRACNVYRRKAPDGVRIKYMDEKAAARYVPKRSSTAAAGVLPTGKIVIVRLRERERRDSRRGIGTAAPRYGWVDCSKYRAASCRRAAASAASAADPPPPSSSLRGGGGTRTRTRTTSEPRSASAGRRTGARAPRGSRRGTTRAARGTSGTRWTRWTSRS